MIPKTDNAILQDRHSNSAGSTRMLLLNSQSCPNICSIGLLILALSCNVDRINEYSGIHQPFHLSIGVIYLPTLRNGFLASFLVACLSAPGQAQPCWKKIHHAETFYLLSFIFYLAGRRYTTPKPFIFYFTKRQFIFRVVRNFQVIKLKGRLYQMSKLQSLGEVIGHFTLFYCLDKGTS